MENHHYRQLESREGFLRIWNVVNATCLSPFKLLARKPHVDLADAYNKLIAELCVGNEKVYQLTTCEFSDSPALERGRDGYVKGVDALATQALVILYLVRDFINGQARHFKEAVVEGSISAYISVFEKFTAAVNCLKCCFTYNHWVWLKWGIPHPHTIPPTELMALVIWAEAVVHRMNQDDLKASIREVVNNVRQRKPVQVEIMENVKRLSMNLFILPDVKYYTSIVEETYTSQLDEYYFTKKTEKKNGKIENYIIWCDTQLRRETALACCFLHKSSYKTVRDRLLDVLLVREIDHLSTPVCKWLKSAKDPSTHRILRIIDKCVFNGPEKLKVWLADMVQRSTREEMETNLKIEKENMCSSHNLTLTSAQKIEVVLRAARTVFNNFQHLITQFFNNHAKLILAMRDVIFSTIMDQCSEDGKILPHLSGVLKVSMVKFAVEEVETNYSNTLDGNDDDGTSVWIAGIYEKLTAEQKQSFCNLYSTTLKTRLVNSVYSGHNNFSTQIKREKKMLVALFSNGASFDFVNRCRGMIDDTYKVSVRLWKKMSNIQPLVLKQFTWELGETDSAGKVPPQMQSFIQNFSNSFFHRFPGLKATFSPKYSVAKVMVIKKPNVKLIMSMEELQVALLFNKQRSWAIEELIRSSELPKEECLTVLTRFSAKGIVNYSAQSSTAILCDVESLPHGVIDLAQIHSTSNLSSAGGSFTEKGNTRSAPVQREIRRGLEAQVARVLKAESPLSMVDVQKRVLEKLARFNVTTRQVKDAVDKLVGKSLVTRDDKSNLLTFMT